MERPEQTSKSFKDKWEQNPQLALSQTLREGSVMFQWILNRNGFSSTAEFERWRSARTRVLDAGCGNGRVTALLRRHTPPATRVVGVDLTSADVARSNLAGMEGVSVFAGVLLGDLSDIGSIDFLYCRSVV